MSSAKYSAWPSAEAFSAWRATIASGLRCGSM
jgi:hypothetical protein